MRFTKKIYFQFVLLVLILFVFITSILIFVYNTNTKELNKKNIELINEQMYYSLNYFSDDINRIKEKIISYNYDSDIKTIMYSHDYLSYNEISERVNSLANKIDTMYIISRFIEKIDFYLPILNRVINKSKESLFANKIEEQYYQNLKKEYENSLNKLHIDNEDTLHYIGSNDLFIDKNSLYEYLVDVELNEKALIELFSTFMAYENSSVYLIGRNSDIFYKSPNALEIDYSKLNTSKNSLSIGKKQYIVLKEESDSLGLHLIMVINEKAFNRYSGSIPAIYIGLLIVLLVIILFSVLYFNRLVEKPIESIVKATGSIEKGEFNIEIEYDKDNEFKILCERFNKMSKRLQNLVDEVYQKDILINQANLKQLQSQINPHFLYNSFFILSRMIKSNDNKNGFKFINHLASYFEYITKVDRENCFLSEEIKHMSDYIEIQKIRYGNKLKINQNNKLDNQDITVPRLILQPVIENYFKYSMANDVDEIVFSITFWKEHDIINIEFKDNVASIKKESLIKLKKELEEKKYNIQTTGLININRRLKITFGDKSGVYIDNIESGGVKTTLKIDTSRRKEKK